MAEDIRMTDGGSIKISEEVIVRISAISAREVSGVAGLGSGSGWGDLLGKKAAAKGIKVDMTEDGAVIEVHVTVKFGVKINEVGYNLQCAVKNAVEEFAGLENVTVNVFVDGIENDANTQEEKEDK